MVTVSPAATRYTWLDLASVAELRNDGRYGLTGGLKRSSPYGIRLASRCMRGMLHQWTEWPSAAWPSAACPAGGRSVTPCGAMKRLGELPRSTMGPFGLRPADPS